MASVSISPIWNGTQFLDNSGKPLSGGKVFMYEAGSMSNLQDSFTTGDGDVANSNPIVLDSSGRMPTDLFLMNGVAYHLVLTKADGSTVLTDVDNVIGVQGSAVSGSGVASSVWNASNVAPTYMSSSQFLIGDNEVQNFAIGNRVRFVLGNSEGYGTVSDVSFVSPNTHVTLDLDGRTIDSTLSEVYWSAATVTSLIADAGALAYSASLPYTNPNTVGGKLRAADAATAAVATTVTQLQQVYTTGGTNANYTLSPNPAATDYGSEQTWTVKFHVAAGPNPTLNVNGLGAKSLKQYNAAGTKVAPVIVAGQLSRVAFDGTDMIFMDPLPPSTTSVPSRGSQAFASNGTFTVPAGVTAVRVTCVGGGGGGTDGSYNYAGETYNEVYGSNGGVGGVAIAVVNVTPGASYGIIVGIGGNANQAGGNSSFGNNMVLATGGNGSGGNGYCAAGTYGTSGVAYMIGGGVVGTGGAAGHGYTSPTGGNSGAVFIEW